MSYKTFATYQHIRLPQIKTLNYIQKTLRVVTIQFLIIIERQKNKDHQCCKFLFMSETNQNELQLRIMYPPKCGYCYYRFFISTNAMSIIVITPGYNLIPINNFVTSFFLCRTLSIKYSFTEIHCRININGIQRCILLYNSILKANESAKEYLFYYN